MEMTSPITFTGPVTVNVTIDVPSLAQAVAGLITDRLDALEAAVTAPLTDINTALAALGTEVDTLTTDEQADRAAFDALAAVVRAFIASVQAGGVLTAEQAAQAQTILDHLTTADAATAQQAADEAALAGEVPPVA